MDPDAPATCKDDFRELFFEEEGEQVEPEHPAELNADYAMYQLDPAFASLSKKVTEQGYDWINHCAATYTETQIGDAARWTEVSLRDAIVAPTPLPDPSLLNESQSFVYRVVVEHKERSRAQLGVPPLRILVCGTAGSGKTFLIKSLKHHLGDQCLVLAPTGVAADNIGGSTYHSKIPIPRKDIDRSSIRLTGNSARLRKFCADWTGVRYAIIDEMSMVGRRSLGQIDEMLRQMTGVDDWFGGLSVILVGDHGQLPPVKDKRAFDWSGCRHVRADKFDDVLQKAPSWQLRGIDAYRQFTDVFFLDRIERTEESESAEYFKGFQLRARDGLLEQDDHNYAMKHLHRDDDRAASFCGPDAKRLVTTRRRRDELNREQLIAAFPAARHPFN